MHIYLIRHTTPDIDLAYCYGQTDLDVAATFLKEAERIQLMLPAPDNMRIFSSPLLRCKKLAQNLAGDRVIYNERLKEFCFGDWEMQRWKEINKKELDYWMEDIVNRKTPHGESFQEMHDRVMAFFNEALSENEQNLIIISHGGAIRAFLANILEMPLKNLFRMSIDFGGISRVIREKGRMKIDYINR